MYNSKLMEMFDNIKNDGLLRGADSIGNYELTSGETAKVYIKVEDGTIVDAKFKTYGCIAAIVVTSVVASLIKNKTLAEAKVVKAEEILSHFEGVKLDLTHAIELSKGAVASAIDEYEEKQRKAEVKALKEQGKEIPENLKKQK